MRLLLAFLALTLTSAASAQSVPFVQLMLDGQTVSGTTTHDQGWVRFLPDASFGWDQHDGSKYMPPLATYAVFALQGERAGAPHYLAVSSLPDGSKAPLGRTVDVRVDIRATEAGTFTFTWDNANISSGWKASLIDRKTGTRVRMSRQDAYTFSTDATGWADRFVLRFNPPRKSRRFAEFAAAAPEAALGVSPEAATELSVSAPAPNPTRGDSRVHVSLDSPSTVRAVVYDALGREAAALDPLALGAGAHTLDLPTGSLPPGVYVLRVSDARGAHTQPLTIVR